MCPARRPPPSEVCVISRQRAAHISLVRVETFTEFALERLKLTGVQLTILLVSDPAMRVLNRRWRSVDKPTDVLSFPQREGVDGSLHPEVLGDIVISVPTALRQAREAGHCLAAELDRLVVHGLLHLIGYEHEADPAGLRAMRRREDAIIRGWRA